MQWSCLQILKGWQEKNKGEGKGEGEKGGYKPLASCYVHCLQAKIDQFTAV